MTSSGNKESSSELREFSAPARVNLIGEHTDYTGGLVMPMAIPFATTAAIRPSGNGQYSFASELLPHQPRTMEPADRSVGIGQWSDYPVGVLRELQALGIKPPPFALHIRGNVPEGSGLSSSASIEVATAMALLAHSGTTLPAAEIALLCQRAENNYVHSPCGIMDQFVVTAAKAGDALLLHTRDLAYELLPMNQGKLAQCRIVVANSRKKHQIRAGDGGYPERRSQLEAGQRVLLGRYPQLRDLGDATLEQLASVETQMERKSFLRCRHIISENGRVREAAEAMLAGDPERLGRIMTAAHASERDDFECSIPEIDFLVETAVGLPGCHGARLTGGGFGGCTVNLVEADQAESFAETLRSRYRDRYGEDASFKDAETYICEAVDGAVELASRLARESGTRKKEGTPC